MTVPHIPAKEIEAFLMCIQFMQYVQLQSRATAWSTRTKASLQQVLHLETYFRNC